MGRFTLIILVLLVFVVIWFNKRMRGSLDNEERRELERLRRKERRAEGKHEIARGEAMLRCDHCGTYFPASKARRHLDKTYCSKRCLDAEVD